MNPQIKPQLFVDICMKYNELIFRIVLFCSILTCLCNSCKKGEQHCFETSNIEVICLDPDECETVPRDSIVDSCRVVILETTKDNLIGSIDQLLFVDDKIVVVDAELSNSIFVFDSDGKYLRKISNRGNGPGEYLVLTHVFILNGNIWIKDNMKSRIIKFSLNGDYLGEVNMDDIMSDAIAGTSANRLLHCTDYKEYNKGKSYGGSLFLITDTLMNPISYFGEALGCQAFHFTLSRKSIIQTADDQVFCQSVCSPYIFMMDRDSLMCKYKIELPDNTFFETEYPSNEDLKESMKYHPSYWGDFYEMDSYSCILYSLTYQNGGRPQSNLYLYRHSDKKMFVVSNEVNNLNNFFFTSPITGYRNSIVCSHNASTLFSYRKTYEQYGITTLELDSLFEKIKVDSNPVLFFYSLKYEK